MTFLWALYSKLRRLRMGELGLVLVVTMLALLLLTVVFAFITNPGGPPPWFGAVLSRIMRIGYIGVGLLVVAGAREFVRWVIKSEEER